MAITSQEAWVERAAGGGSLPVDVLPFVREIVEEIAFQARGDQKVDRRSGVSQRLPITALENVVSNAERRAILNGEPAIVPRVSDIYASLPSLTGKIELEYEGELKGAEVVARDLVRAAVANVFDGYATLADANPVIAWFEQGGTLDLSDTTSAEGLTEATAQVDGLPDVVRAIGGASRLPPPTRAALIDFIFEGLCALKKISRTDSGQLFAPPSPAGRPRDRGPADRSVESLMDEEESPAKGKKKYYN
jgi:magnesium chelatase subunit I